MLVAGDMWIGYISEKLKGDNEKRNLWDGFK